MPFYNSPMLNRVFIVGSVVNDPRISVTNGNKIKVANFRIACSRKFRTKNGLLKEETCYVNVTAWLRLAEICEMNLVRGDKVYIEGSLQSKHVNDNKLTIVEILAERIQILTPKKIVSPGFFDNNKDLKNDTQETQEEVVEEANIDEQ